MLILKIFLFIFFFLLVLNLFSCHFINSKTFQKYQNLPNLASHKKKVFYNIKISIGATTWKRKGGSTLRWVYQVDIFFAIELVFYFLERKSIQHKKILIKLPAHKTVVVDKKFKSIFFHETLRTSLVVNKKI